MIALELNMFQKKPKKLQAKKILQKYRIQANNSVMCRLFIIGFIDFRLKGKRLLDYTNFYSPNEYESMIK